MVYRCLLVVVLFRCSLYQSLIGLTHPSGYGLKPGVPVICGDDRLEKVGSHFHLTFGLCGCQNTLSKRSLRQSLKDHTTDAVKLHLLGDTRERCVGVQRAAKALVDPHHLPEAYDIVKEETHCIKVWVAVGILLVHLPRESCVHQRVTDKLEPVVLLRCVV